MSLGGILQYQTNTASNTQTLGSVKETIAAKPVAQAQELMPGKVFEGMVTDIKNGQVTLGLSDIPDNHIRQNGGGGKSGKGSAHAV